MRGLPCSGRRVHDRRCTPRNLSERAARWAGSGGDTEPEKGRAGNTRGSGRRAGRGLSGQRVRGKRREGGGAASGNLSRGGHPRTIFVSRGKRQDRKRGFAAFPQGAISDGLPAAAGSGEDTGGTCGAGVAGLQAIATARRLGAVASAYDMRPAAKEQVQSLGGRFVELAIEAKDAQDARGYGKAQDESFYAKQRELLGNVIAESDVVITAAVIPGKKSPVLVTKDMVARMAPGSVIVDLAAERGGNCELTKPDEITVEHNVTIIGEYNLAGTVPYHASQMFAKNISAFLLHLVKDGKVQLNMQDEIMRETMVTQDGQVVNARVREFFGLPALAAKD